MVAVVMVVHSLYVVGAYARLSGPGIPARRNRNAEKRTTKGLITLREGYVAENIYHVQKSSGICARAHVICVYASVCWVRADRISLQMT